MFSLLIFTYCLTNIAFKNSITNIASKTKFAIFEYEIWRISMKNINDTKQNTQYIQSEFQSVSKSSFSFHAQQPVMVDFHCKKRIILDDWVSINQLTGFRKPFARNNRWSQQVLCTETAWQLLFRFELSITFYTTSDDCDYTWLGQYEFYHALFMVSSTGPNNLQFDSAQIPKKGKLN